MKRLSLPLLLACSLPLMGAPAFAQTYDAADGDRVDRLERDIMLLQRQLARGGPVPSAPITDGDITAAGPAQLEVRLAAIEEEQRTLRGKIEENEFQIRKLLEEFDKLQRDMEFRFSELSQGQPVSPAAPADEPVTGDTPETTAPTEASDSNEGTTAGDGVLEAPDSETESSHATPRDLYNYAFRLLNQTQYEKAADAFKSFTLKYPKDPLVGNAFYWLGETYYIRRDYVTAADSFRQGFEVLPNGPKSADNLLKLAMSLNALERNEEACVVLRQITTKFKKSSSTITAKADQEQKRIGCK